MRPAVRVALAGKPKAAHALRLRAVQLLTLPEKDAARLVRETESHPLFERLRPYVRRRPVGRMALPGLSGDQSTVQAGLSLAGRAKEVALIRRIGAEAFQTCFIEETVPSASEIAERCGISKADVLTLRAFLLTLESGAQQVQLGPARRRATPIARFVRAGEAVEVQWLQAYYARGRYAVDHEALRRELRPLLSSEERRELGALLSTMELINRRLLAVVAIVSALATAQRRFLVTGRGALLKPLTARGLATALRFHPSTVGRAIEGRAVELPDGRTAPISALLPSRGEVAREAIAELAADGLSDSGLARALRERYGLALSRRAVNDARRTF